MAQSPSASRPLSPHLGIYRKMLTMMLSIVHRITGAALYFGTLLLAWWLVAAASGAEAYEMFAAHAGAWYGQLVLIGYTWALIHHMLGGLRHLVWDMGKGFNLRLVEWMARATVAGSIILTILTWVIAYQIMGAL